MKKMLLALLLSASTAFVTAQTVVPVVWVFALSSTQGNMVREIINAANSQQTKYQFVFEHKPGAGGAVGVNYAASLKQPAILAHTSSYFIRPYMYKDGSYDVNQFEILNNYCVDQPIALISKNYKTLNELNNKSSASVGVLPGSITQLVVSQYKNHNPKLDLVEVGFKGTPDITLQVLAGNLDLSTDWLAGVTNPELNVLAITGVHSYDNAKTFKSQGMSGFENVTNSYYLFVNKNTDPAVAKEFNDIMSQAVVMPRVRAYCQRDFGQYTNISGAKAQDVFKQKHQYWKQSVEKISK